MYISNVNRVPSPSNSGDSGVVVGIDVVLTLCVSRISFWCVRISLKIKNVMNWPMPGKSEPTTASLGKKRVSLNLRRLFKIW